MSTLTHFTTLPFLTHSPETVNHTRGSLAGVAFDAAWPGAVWGPEALSVPAVRP